MGYEIKLDNLPLILAGPILRRTELDYVSVFVVLKEARRVTLRVFDYTEAGTTAGRTAALTGTENSIQLFENVHLVLVRAQVPPFQALYPNELYYYELFFDTVSSDDPVPDDSAKYGFQAENLLNTSSIQRDIFYSHSPNSPKLPSFLTPPDKFSELRLVHGSCRKPQNDGMDALSALDEIIKVSSKRPHQLHLTGDQIYADDVGDPLLFMIHEAHKVLVDGDLYLGLPTGNEEVKKAWDKAIIGERQDFVEEFCGFTSTEAKSHLLGLSEYCLYYLFSWSEVLWPTTSQWPEFEDVLQKKLEKFLSIDTCAYRTFQTEIESLKNFLTALPNVSKALANCPTYMIVDDHDVTDDWFLNRDWVENVMNKGKDDFFFPNKAYAGRFVLRNAYLAFSLFQMWGNTRNDSDYSAFTQEVNKWANKSDINQVENLWHQLGLPNDSEVNNFLEDLESYRELRKSKSSELPPPSPPPERFWHKKALRWDFRINFNDFDLIGLDTRSWRSFPGGDGDDFCALISKQGFEKQLPAASTSDTTPKNLVCLSATPIATIPIIELGQRKLKEWFSSEEWKDAETWGFQPIAFERFLAGLTKRDSQRVLLLSGDVHYSYAARLRYWCDGVPFEENSKKEHAMICAQLTSSSLHNSENTYLHNNGCPLIIGLPEPILHLAWNKSGEYPIGKYSLRGVEIMDWDVGEDKQPLVAEVGGIFEKKLTNGYTKPDWRYRIDYFVGDASNRPASVPTPVSADEAKPDSNGNRPLRSYAKTKKLQEEEAKYTEGRELVGKTNLAFINFEVDSNDTKLTVIQRHYWHDSESNEFKEFTTFEVPLYDVDNQYERPTVEVGDEQDTGGQTIP